MLRRLIPLSLILLLFTSAAFAGIRGPGEYAGVVVFDHWDTCYLYDGTYLMYVSESVKERLRPYAGQTIRINATKVYQPMNPGDGLITEFKFLGLARDQGHSPIAGLLITITPRFEIDRSAQFTIEVRNTAAKAIQVSADSLAPTLLGEKNDDDILSPSDGKSDAKITRWGFPWAKGWAGSSSHTHKGPNGEYINVNRWCGLTIDDGKVPFNSSFVLSPGQSRQFKAEVSASPGDYEFLCGYSGGSGFEDRISNRVFFSIDESNAATPDSQRKAVLITSPAAQDSFQITIINRSHPYTFFSWAALARALAVSAIACLVYRRLYQT
jgi:hypothetical protein